MLNTNVSIKVVISKVIRDLGIGQAEVPFQDFIEWSAEALQQIAAYQQFDKKSVNLPVENHVAVLPCDIYRLQSVRGSHRHNHAHNPPLHRYRGHESKYLHYNPRIIANDDQEYEDKQHTRGADYRVERDRVITSFKEGDIEITYLAMPTDEEGFPLVPGDQSFLDALFWNVVYKLSLRGFPFLNKQLQDVQFTYRMWQRYCGQARATANMPDPDAVQRWAQQWLRLKPEIDSYYRDFSDMTEPQRLDFNGNFGQDNYH